MYSEDWKQSRSFGTLDLEVNVTERGKIYTADTPVVFADGELELTGLTVVQSPIATYVTYEYAATESASMKTRVHLYNGNVWVNWLDESGEPVPEAVMGRGVFGDDDQTTYSCTYRAFDTLTGEMKLEFYRPGAGTIAQVMVPLREAADENQQGGSSK